MKQILERGATRAQEWAEALDLIEIMLQGSGFAPQLEGDHQVMLNGSSSFLYSNCSDPSLTADEVLCDWAWSSNLKHCVHVIERSNEVRVLRSDDLQYNARRFQIPRSPAGVNALFQVLESDNRRIRDDVIKASLRAYRIVRDELEGKASQVEVLRAFNVLLAVSEYSHSDDITSLGTLEDCIDFVERKGLSYVEPPEITDLNQVVVEGALNMLAHGEAPHRRKIDAHLVMRHASSELYQEAHLLIDSWEAQRPLPGLSGGEAKAGRLKKDVRFTPTGLARALTVETFKTVEKGVLNSDVLTVLDPACGSGIFLKEAIRELARRQFIGSVSVVGMDISEVSAAMSKFVLGRVMRDVNFVKSIKVDVADSLAVEWGTADVVLMNPPFVQTEGLTELDRVNVKGILGSTSTGRTDLSMAFLSKAVDCLNEHGVVTSLIPSSIMSTKSGLSWRAAILQRAVPVLIAKFESFGLFKNSIVAPGVISLKRRQPSSEANTETYLLVAGTHSEPAALRALKSLRESEDEGVDAYFVLSSSILADSWTPETQASLRFKERLIRLPFPSVSELFNLSQGVRTGDNKAFIIASRQWRELPSVEQSYFRPVSGQGAIYGGVLDPVKYLFYPYRSQGLFVATEQQLKQNVPNFYERLTSFKDSLSKRSGIDPEKWWALTRPRPNLVDLIPKLITTAFGASGSFGYDKTGETIVVQGLAWVWIGGPITVADGEEIEWSQTHIPYCYLAVLNSQVFETILNVYCPRVQGGQYDLSVQFVGKIPIPNFLEDTISGDLVDQLSTIGEAMSSERAYDYELLESLVSRVYGSEIG